MTGCQVEKLVLPNWITHRNIQGWSEKHFCLLSFGGRPCFVIKRLTNPRGQSFFSLGISLAVCLFMADPDKEEQGVVSGEEERLLEGMAVLDFDMLCSTVAMQSHGKWRVLENQIGDDSGSNVEFGGVLRMWEGELLDCFDDRRIALQSLCCPCYRFGKNMKRAGFGSPFIQGAAYLLLLLIAVLNCFVFILTRRHLFLYLAVVFTISIGLYLGFLRTRIRKKFNIQDGDRYLDDCVYHLVCPCCSMCQEARTLEMNNVQDGAWHGRGDTVCIGRPGGQSNKAFIELHPPTPMSINSSTIPDSSDTTHPC